MADGKIVIDIDVKDNDVNQANKNVQALEKSSTKASASVKQMALSFGAVKVASAAFNVLKQSIDAAISRFDTFQKFPKVMESFGYSAKESQSAVSSLSKGIEGLPTTLDSVVSTTQRLTAMTGNLKQSTQVTLALNNAFLASGASASDASRGTEQYIQQLAKGKVDMQSWRTLQESMSVGLQRVAEQMGFTGEAATTDLYKALQSGEVTFRDFQKHLVDLGTGQGELAQLAKTNSEGMATSFQNLRNAAVKGLANIIATLDELSVKVTGNTIAQNVDSLKVVINKSFDAINRAILASTPLVEALAVVFSGTIKTASALSPVLIGLATAYAALKVIQTINNFHKTQVDLLLRAVESGKNLTLVTKAMAAAEMAKEGATVASTAATLANNGAIKLSTLLYGVMTGSISAGAAATVIATTAVTALKTALTVLMGPIGWVVAGIGALTAGGIALYKWLTKETEASKALNKEQSALVSSTEAMTEAAENNAASRKDEVQHLEASKTAYKTLAEETQALANKQNRSAGETKLLKDNIEQLNSSVDGLNIAYDEENNALSMNTEEINKRIDASMGQEKVNELMQQSLDIEKERQEVEMKLKDVNALRQEWNDKLADGSVKSGEAKKALAELDEQEKVLSATQTQLTAEYEASKQAQVRAANEVAQAIEDGANRQIITFATLSEQQQATVESMQSTWQSYADSATNMFDVLSDKQELSVAQMTANLQENQRVVGEWGTNIAALAERGVDEGLLNTLREAGPSSAGYVAALVASSDEELQGLNTAFKNGGDTATQALKDAFNLGSQEIPQEVMGMVTASKDTLTSEIAAADFGSIGKEIPNGLAQGITDNSEQVSNATKETSNRAKDAFASDMGIHSPSTVFKGYGTNMIEGLVIGITQGTGQVTSALNQIKQAIERTFASVNVNTTSAFKQLVTQMTTSMTQAKAVITTNTNQINAIFKVWQTNTTNTASATMTRFTAQINSGLSTASSITSSRVGTMTASVNTLSGSFYSAGVNASYGLANGINAGAGSALYAARSLANQVAATMREALKIHSPSRLMRDDVGRFIPQGLAEGIKKDSGLVDSALLDMVRLPKIKAESLIGVRGLGVSSSNVTTTKTINNQPNVTMHVYWSGKEDIRRTMEQMAWITNIDEKGGLA